MVDRTSSNNINLIIETHSEIILRTLQAIIKQAGEDDQRWNTDYLDVKKVAIYYVDKKGPGDSNIEELHLAPNGLFEKAPPKEFFDINSNLIREMITDGD